METNIRRVDVLVIGGGVVGCAILRELSRYDVAVALLERSPDICEGTSKSNSAIVHTGFDAPPGSLEARLLAEARELWPNVVDSLHIPYLQTGALMVATSDEELNTVETEIIPKAQRNGVILQRLSREEILANAPYISPDITGGVLIAGEGIIDLFQQQLGCDPLTLDKNVAHSSPIAGRVSKLVSEPVNPEAPLLERRNGLNG